MADRADLYRAFAERFRAGKRVRPATAAQLADAEAALGMPSALRYRATAMKVRSIFSAMMRSRSVPSRAGPMKRSPFPALILLVGLAGCGGVIRYEGTIVVVKAPSDDETLRKWVEEQPGVRDVSVTREGKTVRVRYAIDQTQWEFSHLAPPFKDLGYEASGFGWKISANSRLIPGVPDWLVFIVAIVAGTTTIEGISWLLRRRKTAKPKATAAGGRDPDS